MIGQTLAIFLDSYRDLNSRKLFWITLVLSAVVVGAFALLGADANHFKLAWIQFEMDNASLLYHSIFQFFVIGGWLTWVATILGLISTAGIFPDLISGGSIDLYLAKPIGRARLFLTRYLAGLLFVTLQVTVVAAGSYLVFGLRAHEWKPRLFLAIPIVVCFFSYLYGICVFLGVWTRSTIAALLLTILCWGMFAIIDRSEPGLLAMRNMYELRTDFQNDQLKASKANVERAKRDASSSAMIPVYQQNVEEAQRELDADAKTLKWVRLAHRSLYAIKTLTPKTSDTIEYLTTSVFPMPGKADGVEDPDAPIQSEPRDAFGRDQTVMAGARKTAKEVLGRSPTWIIGTSLLFEAVLVGAAMWSFCRRDY